MNCKRARLHIALRVGDDLDHAGTAELDGHLTGCADCRAHLGRVESNLHPLHERSGENPTDLRDSLWPDLLEKLPPRPGSRMPEFNGWWVALAVSAACAAILLFWQDESQSGRWDLAAHNRSSFPVAHTEILRVRHQPQRPFSFSVNRRAPERDQQPVVQSRQWRIFFIEPPLDPRDRSRRAFPISFPF